MSTPRTVEQAVGGTLGAALAEQDDRLSNCVHCGFCLSACPTYTRLGDEADSPRGRLHLMRAVVEQRLDPGSDAFQRHIDRCLGCRACESVCPSGVEYGLLLERAREVALEARPPARLQRLLLGAIRRPAVLAVWMGASRLLRWTRLPALLVRVLPAGGAIGRARLGAAMLAASSPVRLPAAERGRRGERREKSGAGSNAGNDAGGERAGGAASRGAREAAGPPPRGAVSAAARRAANEEVWSRRPRLTPRARGRAGVLAGCVQEGLFRRVNDATRRVLRANGWEVVDVPGEGCCGALHAHAGRLEDARGMAAANLEVFRAADVDVIVANAAGCGAAMREYAHLLDVAEEPVRRLAQWFSSRVRDVSEVLAGDDAEPRPGAPLPLDVAYDAPCHLLHAQRVEEPPLRLLRSIPGVRLSLVPGADECCGGAGIYGITHPHLGGMIGGDKVEAIRRSGAQVVVTGNPGCIMQIGAGARTAGLDVRVLHPIELLDESYRRGGLYDG